MPFADPNFKLIILQNLLSQGLLDLGTPQEFAAKVCGRAVDLEKDGYAMIPECLQRLYDYPLTEEQLQAVNAVYFDGSLDIYTYAYFFWDGESDEFTVQSLAGIGQCPNILRYNEISMSSANDLSPLAGLPKLESVNLALQDYKNMNVLLTMPQLKSFKAFRSSLSADDQKVVADLKAKGVAVKLN